MDIKNFSGTKMINFSNLGITSATQKILDGFSNRIDFAYQPIFNRSKEIYAYEALMRPVDISIDELIHHAIADNKLHELEIATFFGAARSIEERAITSKVHVNSFPSECFNDRENSDYKNCYGYIKNKMTVEILEYMQADKEVWEKKKKQAAELDMNFSLDDFGSGYNSLGAVNVYNPSIVKLDRSLISDIDKDKTKQISVSKLVDLFHNENRSVLAEGIETKEEYEYLMNNKIDLFQGYFLGRPQ